MTRRPPRPTSDHRSARQCRDSRTQLVVAAWSGLVVDFCLAYLEGLAESEDVAGWRWLADCSCYPAGCCRFAVYATPDEADAAHYGPACGYKRLVPLPRDYWHDRVWDAVDDDTGEVSPQEGVIMQ